MTGALDGDLATAIGRALQCDPDDCRAHALTFTWRRCTQIFADVLEPIPR